MSYGIYVETNIEYISNEGERSASASDAQSTCNNFSLRY